MSKSLLDLADRMNKLAGNLEKEVSRVSISAALEMLDNLVMVTPVDTSNAISNWQISIGSPPSGEVVPYFPGHLGSTRRASAKAAYNVGSEHLNSKQPGQSIYLSNLAPYIVNLNNGSSRQHPGGFVENALVIGRLAIENSKLKV